MIIYGGFPLFIGNGNVGMGCQQAPQIKLFDIFYETAPMVGLYVIGSDAGCMQNQVTGLYVLNNYTVCTSVSGFHIIDEEDDCVHPPLNGLYVQNIMAMACPPVLGFYVENDDEC